MDFDEMRRYELDIALRESPYEKWVKEAERIFGRDLDGDQKTDGFSLDYALDAFERGMTPREYVLSIQEGRGR